MKNNETVHIIGCNHEAINAGILLASLDKNVQFFCHQGEIEQTLEHYKFDRQMNLLWSMYVNDNKIQSQLIENIENLSNSNLVWLFVDELSDDEIEAFCTSQTSPHSQIIISGTKPIGEIAQLAKRLTSQWAYYLPFVFMKDGANFGSFFSPDLVMIGEKVQDSVKSCDVLLFLQNQASICEIADIKTIEFARSSMMAMLATRLSFMNEMARLADSEGVNINHVQKIMGQDKRIGKAYLSAGWGFGGRSLPTEIAFLSEKFKQNQVDTSLLSAVKKINEDQKEIIFRKFWRYFNGFIEHKTVMIWGAGYRVGTSRTTNSAVHALLQLLWSYDIKTIVYTNHTSFELAQQYGDNPLLSLVNEPYDDLARVDSLFIVNWSSPLPPDISRLNAVNVPIFDAKNILTDEQVSQYHGDYVGIGR